MNEIKIEDYFTEKEIEYMTSTDRKNKGILGLIMGNRRLIKELEKRLDKLEELGK